MVDRSRSRSVPPRGRSRSVRAGPSHLPSPQTGTKRHRSQSAARSSSHAHQRRRLHASSSNRAVVRENKLGNVHGAFERVNYTLSFGKGNVRSLKGSGRWKYSDEFYGKMESPEGQQGYNTIGRFAHYGDMLAGGAGVPSEGTNNWATQVGLFNQNPNMKSTGPGASVVGYSDGAIYNNDFINLHSVDLHYCFGNLANTAAILDLYVLQYKTNTVARPQEVWEQGLKSENSGSVAASNAGATLGIYYSAGMGYPTPSIIGQAPESCPSFMRTFRILKKATFDMSADTNIEFHLHLNYDKNISKQYMLEMGKTFGSTFNVDMNYKTTVAIMYRLRGQIVADSSITGSVNPTIGNAKLGYTCARQYVCSPSPGYRVRTQAAMPWLIGTNDLDSERIMDVVDNVANVIAAI